MGLFGRRKQKTLASAPAGSGISLEKLVREQRDGSVRPKRCDVCGATFSFSTANVHLFLDEESLRVDIGGYCPNCHAYVCPSHVRLVSEVEGGKRLGCDRCGNLLVYPDIDLVRLERRHLKKKRGAGGLSLKSLLRDRGVRFVGVECRECGKAFERAERDFLLTPIDVGVQAEAVDVDLGGYCPCCMFYVCEEHAVLNFSEDKGRRAAELSCAICEGIHLSALPRKLESKIPGVEHQGCWHRMMKDAMESVMKRMTTPKQTFSFKQTGIQRGMTFSQKTCDVCDAVFDVPDEFMTLQMDKKELTDHGVTEENFVLDIGGYCQGCHQYFCPQHAELLSADLDGMIVWSATCPECGLPLFPSGLYRVPGI